MVQNKSKISILPVGDYSRLVQMPVEPTAAVLNAIRSVNGIVLHSVRQAGKTEVYYEVDVDRDPSDVSFEVIRVIDRCLRDVSWVA